jgi:septum formation protein
MMILKDKLSQFRIILASQSPRRQELLSDLGVSFDVVVRDFDESFPDGLSGEQIARYVSESKARSFRNAISDNEIVITADTIVWCNGIVLGKPVNQDDAIRMISLISGNTHEVITAVTLISTGKMVTFSDSTIVRFDEMNPEDIKYYVEKFKPYDKAGAYGIQEWIGIIGCSHIEGSYFNVVGLPVQMLYRELIKFVVNP